VKIAILIVQCKLEFLVKTYSDCLSLFMYEDLAIILCMARREKASQGAFSVLFLQIVIFNPREQSYFGFLAVPTRMSCVH